jgi:anti-anti-sigma regulatory factor
MIRETEDFLNARLYARNGGWPKEETARIKLDPRGSRQNRRQLRQRDDERISLRVYPDARTLVEIRPNHRGMVDQRRLEALEIMLNELASNKAAGDIVIGLDDVAVMTAGFMSLLAMVKLRLGCQHRKLQLCGLRPECAEVLRGTGLDDLSEGEAA